MNHLEKSKDNEASGLNKNTTNIDGKTE